MGIALPAKLHVDFDPITFLSTIGTGRKNLVFKRNKMIFSQGDKADAIFYIQEGSVKLTVVSHGGKEAMLGVIEEKGFFGEGALAGQKLRMCSAYAMANCKI